MQTLSKLHLAVLDIFLYVIRGLWVSPKEIYYLKKIKSFDLLQLLKIRVLSNI